MAIILDEKARLVVQGVTGHQGAYHTQAMQEYGTKIVAGVTPGKEGETVHDVPVFNSVAKSVDETGANASIIFVPAPFAKDAAYEGIDAGLKTLVIITEHIPVHDAMQIMQYARLNDVIVIGPNTPGIICPAEKVKVGIMPSKIFIPGKVGVISRSGTLTYEIVNAMSSSGIGQSTCIGLGGDPVVGLSFTDVLRMFEADRKTDAVVIVGEIGGTAEERAAEYIGQMTKNVVAYIAGQTAPPEKRMGHAGAIVSRGRGTAETKIKALTAAGAKVAKVPTDVAALLETE